MHFGQEDYQVIPTNLLLSAGSGAVGFVMANWEPILTFGLPIAFFLVGKAVDVAVKLHLSKKEK
jgi:hypothetical protein